MRANPSAPIKNDHLFELLRQMGERGSRNFYQPKQYPDGWLRRVVPQAWQPGEIIRQTLDRLLENPDRGILLPTLKKDVLWFPILWVRRHKDGKEDLAMQVVVASEKRRFGYRWEPPEGPGKHDYPHVQPITTVRYAGAGLDLELGHEHISVEIPTLPICAHDRVGLADAMLLALYGPDYFVDLEANLRTVIQEARTCCRWTATPEVARSTKTPKKARR